MNKKKGKKINDRYIKRFYLWWVPVEGHKEGAKGSSVRLK
jgi:hypothetical protein